MILKSGSKNFDLNYMVTGNNWLLIETDDVYKENSDIDKILFETLNFVERRSSPITKEQVSFRTIIRIIYTSTNNKFALLKLNHERIMNEDGITTYPLESNIPYIKHFDDKIKPNCIEEIKKIYKKLIVKGQLWLCPRHFRRLHVHTRKKTLIMLQEKT